jgi:ribosome-associated protein
MPLAINDWLTLPDDLVEVRFSRAGGPGGQNVNKVSSRVELLVNLAGWTDLPPYAREKLEARERKRISREGVLRLVCQDYRDQSRNREACLEKLAELLRECLHRPIQRRPTRPSRAAKARRLEGKRRRSDVKRMRQEGASD